MARDTQRDVAGQVGAVWTSSWVASLVRVAIVVGPLIGAVSAVLARMLARVSPQLQKPMVHADIADSIRRWPRPKRRIAMLQLALAVHVAEAMPVRRRIWAAREAAFGRSRLVFLLGRAGIAGPIPPHVVHAAELQPLDVDWLFAVGNRARSIGHGGTLPFAVRCPSGPRPFARCGGHFLR